jgi:putative SOS response-associated peptidase YedK
MTLTRRDLEEVADELEAVRDPEGAALYRPRYNVAPTDLHPIVRLADGRRLLQRARWGFPGGAGRPTLINARSETAPFRDRFREAFVNGTCIVPADGFYEWSGPSDGRRPFWIRRADGRLLLLAGLWEDQPAPDGGRARHFTILTTAANPTVARIHDRMPVVLAPEQAAGWLAGGSHRELGPAPEGVLEARPVSRRVNSVRNDDPGCLAPEDPGRPRQLPLF